MKKRQSFSIYLLLFSGLFLMFSSSCEKDEDDVAEKEDAEEVLTDVDGNEYETVVIGEQEWMAENLKTTTYNDGTSIDLVSDQSEWNDNTTGAYCWYENDEAEYAETYGALYNWYAVDTENLCPDGWHVPSDEEWKTLEMELGMSQEEADETHFRGTYQGSSLAGNASLWIEGQADPELKLHSQFGKSGFNAIPNGYRWEKGFGGMSGGSDCWSATETSETDAWYREISIILSSIYREEKGKNFGHSVRCLKD